MECSLFAGGRSFMAETCPELTSEGTYMATQARSAPDLPAAELDTVPEFAARANASVRTINRKIAEGLPIIKIGRLTRIDPQRGMAYLRGELPPPPPVRRGRPRKITSAILILVLVLAALPVRADEPQALLLVLAKPAGVYTLGSCISETRPEGVSWSRAEFSRAGARS